MGSHIKSFAAHAGCSENNLHSHEPSHLPFDLLVLRPTSSDIQPTHYTTLCQPHLYLTPNRHLCTKLPSFSSFNNVSTFCTASTERQSGDNGNSLYTSSLTTCCAKYLMLKKYTFICRKYHIFHFL